MYIGYIFILSVAFFVRYGRSCSTFPLKGCLICDFPAILYPPLMSVASLFKLEKQRTTLCIFNIHSLQVNELLLVVSTMSAQELVPFEELLSVETVRTRCAK